MITNQLHKPVYIPSLEASDIYSHMIHNRELKFKYVGMIPSSLELEKLTSIGLVAHESKPSEKFISDDIINVKFKQKVKSAKELINKIKKKIERLNENQSEYKQKLIEFVKVLKQEKNLDKWREISNESLRHILYVDGFTLTNTNEKTKKVTSTKYVVYKRSSAKSRIGQCLFIKEELYNEMIHWSQLGLSLTDKNIDVPSLLAYQSLVGSSLESVIHIKPENILIVKDIESKFKRVCNVIRKGENDLLDSFEEDALISNSLFDGQSLLDASYFPEGKGMLLLRNHMFKSAAFNCNIQKYLMDNCPDNIEYDKWEIPDMFGDPILAKNVHLIITPSSLKALKFSRIVGGDAKMFRYWKEFVKDNTEGFSTFGVVKSEKQSKHVDGSIVMQQSSYQMLNSLPMTKDDIHELSIYERDYTYKLKNDDVFFIQHIQKSVNSVNSNTMFIDLYNHNKNITRTKIFRDFRKAEINRHLTHVKHGKIRMRGDYCTMLGNPLEFLSHAIGRFNVNNEPTLKANEIHTPLFDYDVELVGFRNPHTSPSNVLLAKNVYVNEIKRYFNLTDNIVCVNAVNFPLQDILSGSDYDSDTLVLFDTPRILELAKKCFGKYRVCINSVDSDKRPYNLTKSDIAVIDNQLSLSQKNIGRVVNLGQFCMSRYWDLLNNGSSEQDLSDLLKKIDIMTVLSGICIDLAKKFYDIDIDEEVDNVANTKELKVDKPLFWKYVSQNKNINTAKMDCPMDYLYEELSEVKYADHRENLYLSDLLVKQDIKSSDRKQEKKIIEYVEQMCNKINNVYATVRDDEERDRKLNDIIKYYDFYVGKLKVKPETMYGLLVKISKNKTTKVSTKLMTILHKTQRETFLGSFYQ